MGTKGGSLRQPRHGDFQFPAYLTELLGLMMKERRVLYRVRRVLSQGKRALWHQESVISGVASERVPGRG